MSVQDEPAQPKRDILSVFRSFGPAGMTSAILYRNALLAGAGHRCQIVTFNYAPDGDKHVATNEQRGRIHPDVRILNLFDWHRARNTVDPAGRREPNISELDEPGLLVQDDEFESHNYARYFSPEGDYVKFKRWSKDRSRVLHVDYFGQDRERTFRHEYDVEGRVHREIGYVRGKKNRERYFTVDGFCYLVRSYEPETGAGLSLFLFTRNSEKVQRFANLWAWRRAWLEELIAACETKPFVIADGATTPPNLLKLPRGKAAVAAMIHTHHKTGSGELGEGFSDYFDKLECFDAVITTTEEQRDDIRSEYGAAQTVIAIPHALPSIDVSRQLRATERDPQRVVSVSRLMRGKRIDDALQVFKLVSAKVPTATFEIFGAGLAEDQGEVVQELKNVVDELGLREKVRFRGHTSQPLTEMAASGVLLFTSQSEAWGYTVAESLMAGTPVVSYSCEYGPADLISDGEDGFLVEVGDIKQAAKKLTWLLKNEARALEFGQHGKAKLQQKFSDSSILQAWENVFERALSGTGGDQEGRLPTDRMD